MHLDPIITRKVIVKTLATGIYRSLSVKIGHPYFLENKEAYECLTDYGWLFDQIPIKKQPHFSGCIGIDSADAVMQALDMADRFRMIEEYFEITLLGGERLTDEDPIDLYINRNRALSFAAAKRKNENCTSKQHYYISIIRSFERACERYRKILKEDEPKN